MRVVPTPLAGSLESLTRQNDKTEDDGLERILDEEDLADRIARKMLVPLPASASLTVNGDLPETHRYCRPWTAVFLADLAKIHAAMFHKPLKVSSAVRTVEYQERLQKTNGNAAAAEGDVVSPHLTGATIDIAKQGLTRQEMAWMRSWLLPLQKAAKIDVEEEFQQACSTSRSIRPTFRRSRRSRLGRRRLGRPGRAGAIADKAHPSKVRLHKTRRPRKRSGRHPSRPVRSFRGEKDAAIFLAAGASIEIDFDS